MKNVLLCVLASVAFLIAACSTVPITGRKQLSLVSRGEMQSMSYQQYGEFMKTNKLSADKKSTEMVKRVGARIQRSVTTYFAEKQMSDQLAGYQWEFNLVESPDL